MRTFIIAVLGVALVAAIAGGLIWLQPNFSIAPYVSVCQHDEEISPADREAMENAARAYMQTLLGERPGDAFDLMSAYGQTSATREQIESGGRALRAEGPGVLTARRLFLIKGAATSREGVMIPCGGAPGATDFVRQNDSMEQGHVLLSYPINGSAKSAALWLAYERGRWRTTSVFVTDSQILNRNANDLFEQAQAQRAQRHSFNAFVLYRTAINLTKTGPHLQLGDFAAITNAESSFPAPDGLDRPFPTVWRVGGKDYTIRGVTYLGLTASNKVDLVIAWTVPNWVDDQDADRQNREFTDAFMAQYPEWSDSFDAITLRAYRPDRDSGWGTVYMKDGGYAPPPQPSAQPAPSH